MLSTQTTLNPKLRLPSPGKPLKPWAFRGLEMLGVLLGGSWVVISGGISPQMWVIFIVALLITPLIATHEPPSRV